MTIDLAAIPDRQFTTAVRGWNRDEVHAYLTQVAASFVPVMQERDALQAKHAECEALLIEQRSECERLRAEVEGYRVHRTRVGAERIDVLSDVGGQVTAILEAAAAAAAQIRDGASRQAARIRQEALDRAAVIDCECQAIFDQTSQSRQQLIESADRVRSSEMDLVSAARQARTTALRALTRLAYLREGILLAEEVNANAQVSHHDAAADVEELIQQLRTEFQRPDWPLPEAKAPAVENVPLIAVSELHNSTVTEIGGSPATGGSTSESVA